MSNNPSPETIALFGATGATGRHVFTVDALKDRSLYGTYPFVVPKK